MYSEEQLELMHPGHNACPGCGAALAMRLVLRTLGPRTIMTIVPSCSANISGRFPYAALKVPLLHMPLETAAAAGTGLRAALEMRGIENINILAWAGDGGTFDIGFQALSAAAERNEDFIYACYDNEAYMITGIQRSSATPWGAWTTTTQARPKDQPKKDIMEILAAHRIPYAATASVAYPDDLIRKVEKAKHIRGLRFLHIFAPCPPGWRFPGEFCIKVAWLATETRVFPLYEIEDGEKYILNHQPKGLPVREYLQLQGRFDYLPEEVMETIQEEVDRRWQRLLQKVQG